ncbi:kinase-like domain-containing protein [Umbelopsis sp. PMI_123]|nr:kinase-like domain-containing protein [Umbelopsis sp. PMI_123]
MIDTLKDLCLQLDDFEIIKPLAKGQFGTKPAFFMEERNVLAQGNDWMPELYAAFQDIDNLYLVMEYAGGGDLFSVLDRTETLTFNEDEARFYIAEMILAIENLHKLGYVHRDIKPQNILIDAQGHVKLADFAKVTSTTPVGTCDYISPEVLQAHEGNVRYGTEVDWWSVGIVLFEMLQELPPFYSDSVNETYRKIIFHEESLEFSDEYPISEDAKDVISRFLCKKEKRLGCNGSTEDIKSHPFFAGIDWDHIRESTPPFKPVLASPDDTSNFSVHDEEDEMTKGIGWEKPPFIGYTFLENVGISFNESSSDNNEILKLKRQLENAFRTNRPLVLKVENPLDQPTLHSSQWMPKTRLQP